VVWVLANGAEGRNFKRDSRKGRKGREGDAERGKREPLIHANKTLIREGSGKEIGFRAEKRAEAETEPLEKENHGKGNDKGLWA
jgi:hypothetical protein